MKKKTFNHLMAGLVLSCVVLGLTACKSGGSLTGSLAKRTINTISSVLKDNKDEKSADDETGAEGAEEEETGETGKDISGESRKMVQVKMQTPKMQSVKVMPKKKQHRKA